MNGRNDLEHGQIGNWRERVRDQGKRRRARPGAFEGDVFKLVLDQLANSRGAVDVRNDLEQKIWCRQGGEDRVQVGTFVLVPYGAGGHPDRTIVERADQGVDLDTQAGIGELFWKGPKIADSPNPACLPQENT